MLRYIVKKIGYGLLLMLGVTTLVFFLFTVLPSDPARMIMGQRSDLETEEAIRKRSRSAAIDCLMLHPLVNSYSLAVKLTDQFIILNGGYIDGWK